MYCKKCGQQLSDGVKFCPKCGERQINDKPQVDIADGGTVSITSITAGSNAQAAAVQEDNETVGRNYQTAKGKKPNAALRAEIESASEEIAEIWPGWTIIEKIGQGSFGRVYKAKRDEFGTVLYSAIKIIKVPHDSSEAEVIKSEIGLDDKSTTAYFKGIVDECVNEIGLMVSLKGNENIVSVEDYKVIQSEDEIGWTIYIRMELLTSFVEYLKDHEMTEREVAKLGIDICSALEVCKKSDVMHRDIKPENIFVSPTGTFKLGDFGIARKLEKATVGMSQKGTYNYMAPEVYNGSTTYGFKADIYSLGIVLYKLLNNNRLPLLNTKGTVSVNEMQMALENRMRGAELPHPCNASKAMAGAILCACAFQANARFADATVMKRALMSVYSAADTETLSDKSNSKISDLNATYAGGSKGLVPEGNPKPRAEVKRFNSSWKDNATVRRFAEKIDSTKAMPKGKKIFIVSLAAFLILAIVGGIIFITWYTGVDQKIVRALASGDYDTAMEIYEDDYTSEHEDAVADALVDRLSELKESFKNEEMEYAVVQMELSTIRDMNVTKIAKELSEAEDYIEELNVSKIAFSTAEAFFEQADYANAIRQYQLVIEEDGNYDTAKEKLASSIDSYRDVVLADAAAHAANQDYVQAITVIQSALEVVPNDGELTEQVSVYSAANVTKLKNDALNAAAQHAEKGDLESAIRTISAALTGENVNDAELKAAYNDYCDKFVNKAVTEAEAWAQQHSFTAALQTLTAAMKVLPDNAALKEKYDNIDSRKPDPLSTLTAINANWESSKWNEDTPTDPFGVTYTKVKNFAIFSGGRGYYAGEYYAEYRVYGEYITLSGSLISHEDIPENGCSYVKVYADDVLVYTSEAITRKSDLTNFLVDVTGADYIKIVVTVDKGDDDKWSDDYVNCLIMMDVLLWKE